MLVTSHLIFSPNFVRVITGILEVYAREGFTKILFCSLTFFPSFFSLAILLFSVNLSGFDIAMVFENRDNIKHGDALGTCNRLLQTSEQSKAQKQMRLVLMEEICNQRVGLFEGAKEIADKYKKYNNLPHLCKY